MRSGGDNFNHFPQNKLIELANFVQFKRMFCLKDWGGWAPCPFPCLRHWLQFSYCMTYTASFTTPSVVLKCL